MPLSNSTHVPLARSKAAVWPKVRGGNDLPLIRSHVKVGEAAQDGKKKVKSPPPGIAWKNRIKWDSPDRSKSRSCERKKRAGSRRGRGRRSSGSSSSRRDKKRRAKRSRSRKPDKRKRVDNSRSRSRSPAPAAAPVPKRGSKWDEQIALCEPAIPKRPPTGPAPIRPNIVMALSQPGARMVRIPQVMIGRVVGRGGVAIKQFKQISGCEMGLERDGEGTFLLIRGPTPEMAANAEAMINERLLADAMKLPDEDKFRLFNTATSSVQALADAAMSSTTRVFNISAEHVPRVLGVGGDTVYNIQKDAGCTVKIDAGGQVSLSRGTPAQMDKAQRLIMAALEEENTRNPKGNGKSMLAASGWPTMSSKLENVNPVPWVGSQIL